MQRTSKLEVELRPGDKLILDGVVTVELVHKSGKQARLRVSAPLQVKIEQKILSEQA